ncbi:glycoside hydrolase family 28 protein [Sphaerobolus stellatus SS14]|uniref:galacturonan 1,4-alpha-galacturonidase n=1 Tax=Sphaerobolus stellatus (strain SS14) TaxID=990650 RepID=A0A0C9VMM2_SPHS4|nr:glycoside hydrolase family 28 protein [Sphaerobolus stellatus SS14]
MRISLALPLLALYSSQFSSAKTSKTCTVKPLGHGKDDTGQILKAMAECGHDGHTVIGPGVFNITGKMTWDLKSSTVDVLGTLNFQPDIQYWLQSENTYRVIFIQDQSSWFVVTGSDFVIDGHSTGILQGNGQPWWEYFQNHTRADGDGRPVSLTLSNVTRGVISNFKIESPPFWCNAIADSRDVVYNGITCNATNGNPGIDTYRSDNVSLINFDVTCGDDCLAIKGNSTNILGKNIVCRGGNGIAFGSLGQYQQFNDIVENVVLEDIELQRLDPAIQPNMGSAVYFKTWTASVHGSPPTGGGGGGGFVNNVTVKNVSADRVSLPVHVYQTNGGQSGDLPSQLRFSNLTFINFTGTALSGKLVDIECSPAVPCPDIVFQNFNVTPPSGSSASFICDNVISITGLPGPCTSTGH